MRKISKFVHITDLVPEQKIVYFREFVWSKELLQYVESSGSGVIRLNLNQIPCIMFSLDDDFIVFDKVMGKICLLEDINE